MASGYTGFINLQYSPSSDDVVCTYRITPAKGTTFKVAAEAVAGESSIGTWTDVSTMNKGIKRKLKPNIFSVKKDRVKIAYPQDLFEQGNMPQIMSSIAGNIFGMKILKGLRFENVDFPPKIANSFSGPAFGISGIRKTTKTKRRPLVGTIVKPKLGLTNKQHARVAFEAWIGGLDLVKDDENLSSMTFNKFFDRIIDTIALKEKAEGETGEKKIYMPNVTAETEEMIDRAKFVKKQGNEYAMVDVVTTGFSGLQTLRRANLGLVLHGHRAMHAAFTRDKLHGISMLVLAKACRLVGVDQLHIGTVVGKMQGGRDEVVEIANAMRCKWHNVKTVLPVASGGLHPGHVPDLIRILGVDAAFQFGGGVHGHPKGTRAGAKAVRQAVDAALSGTTPLKEYSKTHAELAQALSKWR
ncbi:MAG: type III ribulose-bisphosphate carboxylase [Candidatus Micrarchaeia archaeon]